MFADATEALRQVVKVVGESAVRHVTSQVLTLVHRVFVGVGSGHGPLRRLIPAVGVKDGLLGVLKAEEVILLARHPDEAPRHDDLLLTGQAALFDPPGEALVELFVHGN